MKNRILDILCTEATGSSLAIRARTLAARLCLPERELRALIRELIADGHPVASSTQPPYGFFMATTAMERQRYVAQLKSRMAELAARLRDFEGVSAAKGQVEMW